jgi:endo-chitodextinase
VLSHVAGLVVAQLSYEQREVSSKQRGTKLRTAIFNPICIDYCLHVRCLIVSVMDIFLRSVLRTLWPRRRTSIKDISIAFLLLVSALLVVHDANAQLPPNGQPALSKRGSIDIDGNGKSVLLVRTTTSNGSIATNPQTQVGRLVGNQFQFTSQADLGASFRIVGVTDYDGNGRSDLLVQNMTQGEFGDVQLLTDFLPAASRVLRQVKQVWDVQAVGDLDGDGKGDLVWRYVVPNSPDTGVSYIWFSNGNNLPIVRKRGGAPLNWTLLGATDLNADNAADMVYISPDNQIRILMATSNRTCANMTAGFIPSGFTGLAFADFTGRNRGDVLIRNNATGQVSLLALNASGIPLPTYTGDPDDRNASCTPSTLVIPSQTITLPISNASWQFYAAGDYDGNGTFDIVWLKPDGTLALWLMGQDGNVQSNIPSAGSTAMGYASTNGTTYWSPVGGSNITNPPPPPPPTTNQAPTVSITTPVAGTSVMVNTVINIAANAADSDGTIAKVEFFANGVKLGEDTATPYVWVWTPTITGAYTITARATDNEGAASNSTALNVTITAVVTPPPPTNQAPTVSVTAPANNASVTIGTVVNITANAADSDGTVTKVEFFASLSGINTKLGEDAVTPYSFSWTPITTGTYSITARATDNRGASTTSTAMSVWVTTVVPPPVNQPPTVSLTAPANNVTTTVGTLLSIVANAADADGTVTKVEFFTGAIKLGERTAAPFTFNWTPTTASSYSLTAKATDNQNAVTTSASVNVIVTALTPPQSVADFPATDAEASRFLNQATFGARMEDIQRLRQIGYNAWFNEQFTTPRPSSYVAWQDAVPVNDNFRNNENNINASSFWTLAVKGNDQLRQRMAWALSQITVVSGSNDALALGGANLMKFADILADNSLGNYRNLLEGVTYSYDMAIMLTYSGNERENFAGQGVQPDQNYAREIMQLFTIGRFELNQDGTRKKNADGSDKETYSAADVRALSKVFTGLLPDRDSSSLYVDENRHSCSEKRFLGAVIDAGKPSPPPENGKPAGDCRNADGKTESDIKIALDVLFNHPNVGPFIGQQLIQRFVTSNPSPDYVSRVAAKFNNNGAGVRGDLKAVIKQVLLDPEARSIAKLTDKSWGKLREPVLLQGQLMRVLKHQFPDGRIWVEAGEFCNQFWGNITNINMTPYYAPSVFNFYRPGFAPPATQVAANNLVAPEYQITDLVTAAAWSQLLRTSLARDGMGSSINGLSGRPADDLANNQCGRITNVTFKYDELLPYADTAQRLTDQVNLVFAAGQLSVATQNSMLRAIGSVGGSGDTQKKNRVKVALMLALHSPSYLVQK